MLDLVRSDGYPMEVQAVVVALSLVIFFKTVLVEFSAVDLDENSVGRKQDGRAGAPLIERNYGVDSMESPRPIDDWYLTPTDETTRSKELHPTCLGVAFGRRLIPAHVDNLANHSVPIVLSATHS